jgi:hypothetical protein
MHWPGKLVFMLRFTRAFAVLLIMIKLRLVTSIAMSSFTILSDPGNEEYLLVHARPAMTLLQDLCAMNEADVTAQFKKFASK